MFNDFIVNKLYSINCLVTTHILLKNLFFFDSQSPLSQLQRANYPFYFFIPPPPEFPVLQIRVPPESPDLRFPTFPVR